MRLELSVFGLCHAHDSAQPRCALASWLWEVTMADEIRSNTSCLGRLAWRWARVSHRLNAELRQRGCQQGRSAKHRPHRLLSRAGGTFGAHAPAPLGGGRRNRPWNLADRASLHLWVCWYWSTPPLAFCPGRYCCSARFAHTLAGLGGQQGGPRGSRLVEPPVLR
jgi:hypothetical protein